MVKIPADCFSVSEETIVEHGEKFVPSVIEPSYGIDRILYCILEHSLEIKEDYTTLHLTNSMAPIKVSVFPLMAKDGLDTIASEIDLKIRKLGKSTFYDGSGSIGRRYARADEIGIPYAITVDYESKEDNCVTIRERDSTNQKRIGINEVEGVIIKLFTSKIVFEDL